MVRRSSGDLAIKLRIESRELKIISWNVNGIRAGIKNGFSEKFVQMDADVFCIQETKAEREQVDIGFLRHCEHGSLAREFDPQSPEKDGEHYLDYWNSADKKGYSGTAVFTKIPPLSVAYGIGIDEHDHEGRMITLEFDGFYLINVYVPNSQDGLARLDYRMRWEDDFREYVCKLDKIKPVIICGDLNVAHTEIDICNPKSNEHSAGFTKQEREKFTQLLGSGFTDTYRYFYPDKRDAYTWWSYMRNARENNRGWRIDYFLVSNVMTAASPSKLQVKDAFILPEVRGSDHCPIGIVI